MVYSVIFEATAKQDALEYAAYIRDEGKDPAAAARWLSELGEAANSLAEMPRRFRVIDEQAHFPIELRQFLHHSHRVIFHVNDGTASVHVLRVYHGRRDILLPGDVTSL